MSQISKGFRTILEVAWIYSFFQNIVSRKPVWPDLVAEFLPSDVGPIGVLDIGCGPGNFLHGNWLAVDLGSFVGIDPSPEYITRARTDFPEAEFIEGTVETVSLDDRRFDLVVMSGVLHHLDDPEAARAMKYAVDHLAEGGTVITIDPVIFPGQNPFARWMALADRGQNVRSVDQLKELWSKNANGAHLTTSVKHGYLRVPYNHVVCVVRKGLQGVN